MKKLTEYRFECNRCRECCSGGPGYVFLSEKDLNGLLELTDLERDQFIKAYTRYIDYGDHYLISLKERKNYDCIFLSPTGCTVYEKRPIQCRTYPFWKRIAENLDDFASEGEFCPGIGSGRVYDREEIERLINEKENNRLIMVGKDKRLL